MSKNQNKVEKQEFGKAVYMLREHLGVKQKELAQKLDITTAAMSRIETGEVHISLTRMLNIVDLLGFDTYTESKIKGAIACQNWARMATILRKRNPFRGANK